MSEGRREPSPELSPERPSKPPAEDSRVDPLLGAQDSRVGPLLVEHHRKDDGRSLILYREAEDEDG
ncbi:MAG TPA: hypothetical protein VGL37_06875 [Solirubrobacteraceae bacterium]|jgi:hypothetical protein